MQDAGQRRIYIDGVLDGLEIPAKPAGQFFLNNTSLGGTFSATASHWVDAVIDEVSIWNRALGHDEIAVLSSQGLPQAQPRTLRIEAANAARVSTDGSFEINWSSTPETQYTVQRADSLSEPAWVDVVTGLPSDGATTSIVLDLDGQVAGFYRIVVEP